MSNGTGIIYSDYYDDIGTRALFGKVDTHTQNYIFNNLQTYCSTLGTQLQGFADDIMQRYHNFYDYNLQMKINSLKNNMNNIWMTNSIKKLDNLHAIQQAPQIMIPYIMAHPFIRASYQRDGCYGYGDSYIDKHPIGVGEGHYDYRRVMNGVVDKGKYVNYHEKLGLEDLLNIFEKNNIRHTWKVIDGLIDNSNSDPTDPWGNGTII